MSDDVRACEDRAGQEPERDYQRYSAGHNDSGSTRYFTAESDQQDLARRDDTAMKTQYYTASSLNGSIATEDDSLEWLFPLGDLNDSSQ